MNLLRPYLHVHTHTHTGYLIGCASLSLQGGVANDCPEQRDDTLKMVLNFLVQTSVEVLQCLLDSNLKIK